MGKMFCGAHLIPPIGCGTSSSPTANMSSAQTSAGDGVAAAAVVAAAAAAAAAAAVVVVAAAVATAGVSSVMSIRSAMGMPAAALVSTAGASSCGGHTSACVGHHGRVTTVAWADGSPHHRRSPQWVYHWRQHSARWLLWHPSWEVPQPMQRRCMQPPAGQHCQRVWPVDSFGAGSRWCRERWSLPNTPYEMQCGRSGKHSPQNANHNMSL